MKKHYTKLFASISAAICCALPATGQTDAFPGAEGGGRYATGGRGGKVIYVTNLNDAGTGSLRWAVSQSGARTILFKVSGNIELESDLRISNGNLTIAGQSAPGDGITVKDFATVVSASNVVIRFMRFRLGSDRIESMSDAEDAIWGRNQQNIILDHCSMSWSLDECASFYDNTNFTMQWCILTESLRDAGHSKGKHGYGGIWGGKGATFHHNLLANHDSRNPRFCGSRYSNRPDLELVDFRNNVIYNWGGNNAYAAEGGSYNLINNYYKPGPASSNKKRLIQPYGDDGKNSQPAGVWGRFYVNGNVSHGNTDVTGDNWIGVTPSGLTGDKSQLKSDTEFTVTPVTTHTADMAFEKVMELAGASLHRDAVDERVIAHTIAGSYTANGSNGSRNGLIDSPADVGGFPYLYSEPAPTDSDGDGIPDDWEISHNLNPASAADGNGHEINSNYTNLEMYLNSLVDDIMRKGTTLTSGIGSNTTDQSAVITIQNGLAIAPDAVKIQMYTLNGVLVRTVLSSQLSLEGIATGIYILQAIDNNGNSFQLKMNKDN